jgi:hypothetical protein
LCYSYIYETEREWLVVEVRWPDLSAEFYATLASTQTKDVTNCVVSDWLFFVRDEVDTRDAILSFARSSSLGGELLIYEAYIEAHDLFRSDADLMNNPPSKVAERTLFSLDRSLSSNLQFTFDPAAGNYPQSVGYRFLNLFGTLTNPVPTNLEGFQRKFRLRTCHYHPEVNTLPWSPFPFRSKSLLFQPLLWLDGVVALRGIHEQLTKIPSSSARLHPLSMACTPISLCNLLILSWHL